MTCPRQPDCSKSSAAELMQYRCPPGAGPSSNTCPRWAPHRAQVTSVRAIPCEVSGAVAVLPPRTGARKLGHPVPESNLASELKRSWPQQTQR